MQILVVGLNHRTAPVEVREKLAFDAASAARALGELRAAWPAEAVVLSTCNRTELYIAGAPHDGPKYEDLVAFLSRFHNLPTEQFASHLYRHEREAAVRHLFRVAGSLDSMVLGESQIISQVKEAWTAAVGAESVGKVFHRLFHSAFEVAKRIHTETAVGQGKVSVSSAAVDLVREIFSEFSDKTVLLVGAGKMSELTLRHLLDLGIAKIQVCNRSPERAENLAGKYGARTVPFAELYDALAGADIVISGTGAREPVIRAEPFREVVSKRRFRTMFLIDIAVPRDIEPGVGDFTNVYLYNIDDLNRIVERNVDQRLREAERCREIIDEHIRSFFEWFDSRDVGPMIGKLQEHVRDICAAELDRLKPKLTGRTEDDFELIRQAVHRALSKVLHVPVEQMKLLARDGDGAAALRLVERLFNLGQA